MEFLCGAGETHVPSEANEDTHLVEGNVTQLQSLTPVNGFYRKYLL
jgi:hypothetical protein